MTTTSTHSLAKALIEAKEALELAEKAKKQAEADLKLAFAQDGIAFTVVDGLMVKLIDSSRPSYDAEALRNLISAVLFKKVTKPTVDAKMFKSAVEMGSIKSEVADAITSVTEFQQFRVTDVAKDKGVAETSTSKVA